MIIALVIAGVVQVYLQRLRGVNFMEVQNILLPFYGWRTIGGLITLVGGLIIAYDFIILYHKRKLEE
jgi:cbb3-type cytochrome oxidase subunit 1